jgi:hypothetical protein
MAARHGASGSPSRGGRVVSIYSRWALFVVPLLTMVVAWIGLLSVWRTEEKRIRIWNTVAMFFPTLATLIASGVLAYVQSGGRVDALKVYGEGLLISLLGVVLCFVVSLEFRRWFSTLALVVSTWMLLLFGLMASAAD